MNFSVFEPNDKKYNNLKQKVKNLEKENGLLSDELRTLRDMTMELMRENGLFKVEDYEKSGVLSDYGDTLLQERIIGLQLEVEYLEKELCKQSQEYMFYRTERGFGKMYMISEKEHRELENYKKLKEVLSNLDIR